MIDFYKIPVSQINNIKSGADWTMEDGTVIENARLVTPADKPRTYAYCSDTKYLPELHKIVSGVDVLYHEATYSEDMMENAEKYCHSTARQAAMVARDANVGKLLLGHYSARYEREESVLLEEAQKVFENSHLTNELQVITV